MILAAALAAPGSAGCATIAHGGRQDILVTTAPSGAAVLVNGVKVDDTPATVPISRKDRILARMEELRRDHRVGGAPIGVVAL